MQRGESSLSCLALLRLALPADCRTRRGTAGQGRRAIRSATAPTGSIDESVRVGSFSHLDKLLPHYTLAKAAAPLPLPAAASEPKIEYRFENQT